mmetsp:Transcript_30126/g.41989  ORF Transcript_30126/g.41989 Transcript_30126/m.41989 type:complete len:93 (-) Transcript_30126:9-287(-)
MFLSFKKSIAHVFPNKWRGSDLAPFLRGTFNSTNLVCMEKFENEMDDVREGFQVYDTNGIIIGGFIIIIHDYRTDKGQVLLEHLPTVESLPL